MHTLIWSDVVSAVAAGDLQAFDVARSHLGESRGFHLYVKLRYGDWAVLVKGSRDDWEPLFFSTERAARGRSHAIYLEARRRREAERLRMRY